MLTDGFIHRKDMCNVILNAQMQNRHGIIWNNESVIKMTVYSKIYYQEA